MALKVDLQRLRHMAKYPPVESEELLLNGHSVIEVLQSKIQSLQGLVDVYVIMAQKLGIDTTDDEYFEELCTELTLMQQMEDLLNYTEELRDTISTLDLKEVE